MKYIAKVGFHDSRVGRVNAGDKFDDNEVTRELKDNGYLEEYKTKVVKQRPEKVTKKKKTKKK